MLDDRDACALVEPLLASWRERFASGGPMFMYVADPVERYSGLVAAVLGDRSRAIPEIEIAIDRGDAGIELEARARAECRARLVDIREDLAAVISRIHRTGSEDQRAAIGLVSSGSPATRHSPTPSPKPRAWMPSSLKTATASDAQTQYGPRQ